MWLSDDERAGVDHYDLNLWSDQPEPPIVVDSKALHFQVLDQRTGVLHKNLPFSIEDERRKSGPPGPEQQVYLRVHLAVEKFGTGFHRVRVTSGAISPDSPVVETYVPGDSLSLLNREFQGKRVWLYGLQTIVCVPSLRVSGSQFVTTSFRAPLRITHVDRSFGATVLLGPTYDAGFHYSADDPLVIDFDAGHLPPRLVCGRAYAYAADRWDFERLYSFKPPRSALGSRVRLGMTHEDVAFILGFPPGKQTKSALLRARRWDYPASAAGLTTPLVFIFKNDRVVQHSGHW